MLFTKYFNNIPEHLSTLFNQSSHLWSPLNNLENFIKQNIVPGDESVHKGDVWIEGNVEIGEGTIIEHGVVIIGPAIIGKNCYIRAHAYIRGHVVVGDDCVIGHTTEVVRSIFFPGVRVDHFNYIGDSILGNKVHFGAGAKVANLRFDEKEIRVAGVPTGRKKFGVILGDECQIGINVSIGLGAILEKNTWLPNKEQIKGGYYNQESFNPRI